MSAVLCFGEILWDFLPAGLFLGGAPMNVAYHLHSLGREAIPVSALGDDQLGRETRRRLSAWDMEDRFVATVAADTGSVPVSVDASGSPSYIITEDVAWDRIPMNEGILEAAASASALVFGSLAQRSQGNQDSLARLREAHNGLILFDINLRAPFDDLSLVEHLGQGVDVLKLNNEELERWVGDHLENGARRLSDRLGCERVLVTAGAKGAGLLDGAGWHWVDTPSVTVADTVGAGDSFAAAFLDGLLAGKDGPECLRRASSLAAWVASSQGATPDYTTCLEWVRA